MEYQNYELKDFFGCQVRLMFMLSRRPLTPFQATENLPGLSMRDIQELLDRHLIRPARSKDQDSPLGVTIHGQQTLERLRVAWNVRKEKVRQERERKRERQRRPRTRKPRKKKKEQQASTAPGGAGEKTPQSSDRE